MPQFGFKNNMFAISQELDKIRAGSKQAVGALAGKRDVALFEYLAATYPEGCGKDGAFDPVYLYNELGINPNTMTVEQLIDLDQDSRWLVPEIFRDAIKKGLRTSPFYNSLIALSETVAQPQVNMPSLDLSDSEPQDTAEGETISTGSISYDNKMVEITKQAIGIDITYEAIQYTKINLLSIFVQDIGIKLGQKLNNSFVDVMINGDQADASESAAVIGIDNTTTGFLYRDLLVAWLRGSRLGRRYTAGICGEGFANTILNLTEFKDKQAGSTQQNVAVNQTLPNQLNLYVSAQPSTDYLILIDPTLAAVQLTSAPLLVEGEKIVRKQIQGSFASITTGFANIFRDARVIIDRSLARVEGGANDFPSYMTPTL